MLDIVSLLTRIIFVISTYVMLVIISFFKFCRYMYNEAKTLKEPVGFLDPCKITDEAIKDNEELVLEYVTEGLLAQKDKEYLMFPYRPGYVCCYLVIFKQDQHFVVAMTTHLYMQLPLGFDSRHTKKKQGDIP